MDLMETGPRRIAVNPFDRDESHALSAVGQPRRMATS